MADSRDDLESLADRLNRLWKIPDTFAKWPWVGMLAGLVTFIGGLSGISPDFGKMTFAKVEGGPSIAASAVGAVLLLGSAFLTFPWLKAKDSEDLDRYEPAGPVAADRPVVLVTDPLGIDEDALGRSIEKFGRDWTGAEIRWPLSSLQIHQRVSQTRAKQDQVDVGRQAGLTFVAEAPGALKDSEAMRRLCEATLPPLVRRCAALDDESLAVVIKHFTLLANYRSRARLASLILSGAPAAAALRLPKSWKALTTLDRLLPIEEVHRLLLGGFGGPQASGRLRAIGDWSIEKGAGGQQAEWRNEVWLQLPLNSTFGHIDTRQLIHGWLIPQFETKYAGEARMPPVYDGAWKFDLWRPTGAGSGTGLPGSPPVGKLYDVVTGREIANAP